MPDFFIGPGDGPLAGHVLSAAPPQLAGAYVDWGLAAAAPTLATPTGAAASAATGTNPLDTQYSIFGHNIPLSVLGDGRIGGEEISGPWTDGINVSGGVSLGVSADPAGTRTLTEVAFDSEVIWRGSQVGAGTLDPSGFTVEPFTIRWYDGTLTQSADALETLHFGTQANAYRGQMMLFIQNCPLGRTKFSRFPYVAGKVLDSSGADVNWGEAFERLAASPYCNFPAFETSGITDGLPDGGLIITQDTQFLQLAQQVGRFYNWDILQTDKLRIVDRGSNVTADIVLDATRLMGALTVTRQGQDTIAKDLELSTIDPDSDYMIVPSLAQRPRDPVEVTTSVGKDTAYLPAIMDSSTRTAIVTYAKYREVQTGKTISGTAMAYGLEIEPGDLVAITGLGDDFNSEIFKVVETLHGANYTVEFTAQSIMRCSIGDGSDPNLSKVVLLMGFEGANGSTGAPGLTDESPAAHGNASLAGTGQISTAQFKFGSSSLRVSATDNYIIYGSSSDWSLSTANSDQFTIEGWIYYNTFSSGKTIVSNFGASDGTYGFVLSNSSTELNFGWSPTGTFAAIQSITTSGAGLATGSQIAWAVDKDATGKIRIYVNGVMKGSATPANSVMHNNNSFAIGGSIASSSSPDAWIDEVRVTKGIARYASNSGYTVSPTRFSRV